MLHDLICLSYCIRSFVEKNYKDLKTLNPKLPILIRECRGTEPQLWVRYGKRNLCSYLGTLNPILSYPVLL